MHHEISGWNTYILVQILTNEAVVKLSSGIRTRFLLHSVHIFIEPEDEVKHEGGAKQTLLSQFSAEVETEKDHSCFYMPCMKQIKKQSINWFNVTDSSAANEHCVYKTRFVDYIKRGNCKLSMLCIGAVRDRYHERFTSAPTISRVLLLFITQFAANWRWRIKLREIKKASYWLEVKIGSPSVNEATKEIRIRAEKLLYVRAQMNIIPEAPLHLYNI